MEIAVNLAVISFNSGQVPFAKHQERLEVTLSPLTRQYLYDKSHHRVSASVMKERGAREEEEAGSTPGQGGTGRAANGGGGRDLRRWEVLVITG